MGSRAHGKYYVRMATLQYEQGPTEINNLTDDFYIFHDPELQLTKGESTQSRKSL